MSHGGGGFMGIRAAGRLANVFTTPSINASSQELRFARACASGAAQANASSAAPSAVVAATHGRIARLASTEYGPNCRKVAAVSGHVPHCVASERTSVSRTREGSATWAAIHRSNGPAHAKMAPTQEKESANEADATLS